MNKYLVVDWKRHRRVTIDTAPFIYMVEGGSPYNDVLKDFFNRVQRREIRAFTSALTLTEVLTIPLRKGQTDFVQSYRELLLRAKNLRLVDLNHSTAERAAQLRADNPKGTVKKSILSTPDAIQIATAIESQSSIFLTNDKDLKKVKGLPQNLKIVTLEELDLSFDSNTPNV